MDKHTRGQTAYISGHAAEQAALNLLRKKGYKLVAQNVRMPRGSGANELDLVVYRQNILVFVEVKKRQSLDEAAFCITPRMQQRLLNAGAVFLSWHPEFENFDCRFDVILFAPNEPPVHLENVLWEET